MTREALVERLRKRGIKDRRVLAAIAHVPRERFVAPGFETEAYCDTALPIACGQTISQPYVVAFMTEALNLRFWHRVLEIGTGSGYQAAVLAHLCRHVYTIERHVPLYESACARFAELGLRNITAKAGDGFAGWPEEAPFDRIIVTAAARDFPDTLIAQLIPGGKMVIPIGRHVDQQYLYCLEKTARGYESQAVLPVRFVPLVPGCERTH